MNNIIIINGSPKEKNSASEIFIDKIKEFLDINSTIYHVNEIIKDKQDKEYEKNKQNDKDKKDFTILHDILNTDVLLIVFPLYVDSLPSTLIKTLNLIEDESLDIDSKAPIIYALSNCGFFEAEHNKIALDIIKNFSTNLKMSWGYGIGIGGGGLIASQIKNNENGKLNSNIFNVFKELSKIIQMDKSIQNSIKKENVFLTPKMPRFMYQFGGNIGWYQMANKNRTIRSLKSKPHLLKK